MTVMTVVTVLTQLTSLIYKLTFHFANKYIVRIFFAVLQRSDIAK